MTPQDIVQIISTVGFPIVVAGAMFWYIVKEMGEMRKVVAENTKVIAQLLEHFKKEDRNVKEIKV